MEKSNLTQLGSGRVSIVLPVYNGAKYLRQSIDSCLNQTYRNIELVIVDDGSTEEGVKGIVESYKDERIKFIRHNANRGLAEALNTGFSYTIGDYLTWTSSDNMYLPQALERMVGFLEESNLNFVYSDFYISTEGVNSYSLYKCPSSLTLKKINCIGPCFLYTRMTKDKVGDYNQKMNLVEDYDYWMRVSKHFAMGHLEEPLYLYRYHKDSLTERYKDIVWAIASLARIKNGLTDIGQEKRLFIDNILSRRMVVWQMKKNALRDILLKVFPHLYLSVYKKFITMHLSGEITAIMYDVEKEKLSFDEIKARVKKIVD